MMRTYYDMLLMSGMQRLVHRELRQMDQGFYGCGLPHPGIECFIAQFSKLLTNYGCDLGLGNHLQNSMKLMIVEGGVSTQILSLPFSCYSKWVTHSRLCSVWEKVELFNLQVKVKEVPLKPPREHDGWLMLMLEGRGYTEDEQNCLNWF